MTGKWGEIKGKLDLVRVSGEFQLSEIELSGFYSAYYGSTVPCEQRKNIEQFRMNKCPVQVFKRSKIRPAPLGSLMQHQETFSWRKRI